MTTPLPQTPGDRREDNAIAAGQAIGGIYAQAEQAIIGLIAQLARKLASGSTLPTVAAQRLARSTSTILAAAATRARTVLDAAAAATSDSVRQIVAQDLGAEAAMQVAPPDTTPLTASLDGAVSTAADNVQAALTGTTNVPLPLAGSGSGQPPAPPKPPAFGPFRGQPDPYQYAVRGAIYDTRGGMPAQSLSLSRLQAAQKALDDLAAHGITGFTDKAGRNWDLATYVEMATRTAVSQMWDEMHAGAMIRSGLDLIFTFTHSTEGSCPRCIPWLGKRLSLMGATAGYPTLDEARGAGFRHPNCRCSWVSDGSADAAEVTNPVPLDQAAEVYKASQQQRLLERRVRVAARRVEAAITPQARRRAREDLAAARAASAGHRHAAGLRMMKVTAQRRERPRGAR